MKKSFTLLFLLTLCLTAFSQGVWDARTSLPAAARQSSFAFEVGGFGFIGTGNYAPGPVYLADLWRYNPANDSWVQKASFPANVTRAVAVTINGIAYAGTGHMLNGIGNVNTWYSYDPATDQWTQKASFPGTPRQDAFAVAVNGKAYVGGGVFSTNPNVFQDLWEYNPVTDTWTQKGNLPSPRAFTTEFVINNKAYMVGGTTAPGSQTSDVHEYDPATDSWTQKAPFPIAANEMVSFALNGKGYVGLGSISGALQTQWYEFDPAANQWQSIASFPGLVRQQSIAFQAGNNGFVFAGRGANSNYLNDLWRFTPGTSTGTTETANMTFTQVYPNPANDFVKIESGAFIEKISLYDLQGRLIKSVDGIDQQEYQLELSDIENGVYMVQMKSGTNMSQVRIVIQK